ncbi:hypothetical protein BH09GEM1_BH09GEM1_21070 [soil metagenome]
MINNIRRFGAPLALTIVLALAACSSADKKPDSALARDTALNKDLAMANRDTAAQPALNDVAATPRAATNTKPAAAAPRPKPAPPRTTPKPAAPTTTASGNTVTKGSSGGGGSVGTIASGTNLSLRSNARVCTNTYTPGQTFTATLANAVTGSGGATIPAGATVSLEVVQLKRSENATDKILMEFSAKSISFGGRTYPISASIGDTQVDKIRNEPKSKDVQKVVGGAIIGAIAGQIMGKSTKATVIGAGAGAAAGAGVAAGTANYEGCVPDGGAINISLTSPVQVKLTP